MALYDKEGKRLSGHKAGSMIAKRFYDQPEGFPSVSDILGSDWLVGEMPAHREDYRRLCIETACKVYDQSAQFC